MSVFAFILCSLFVKPIRSLLIQRIPVGSSFRLLAYTFYPPSEICKILRNPNSIIASSFIKIISKLLKGENELLVFLLKTASFSGFLDQRFNNLQRAALLTSFWRLRLNNLQRAALLTSLDQYDKIRFNFGQQQLGMVNYACGFNQSETGKYFEWIII